MTGQMAEQLDLDLKPKELTPEEKRLKLEEEYKKVVRQGDMPVDPKHRFLSIKDLERAIRDPEGELDRLRNDGAAEDREGRRGGLYR